MSSEEPDLPVAADVDTVADGVLNENDLHAVLRDEEIVEEGDELVKKSDAQEAKEEARQAERQKILDKLHKQLTNYREKSEDIGLSDREIGACEELRTLQRNLRKDLKKEVKES